MKIKFGTAAAAGLIGLLSVGIVGLIFGGLFGLFWGWVATFIFANNKSYTKKHPVYRKYIYEGWSTSEPTA